MSIVAFALSPQETVLVKEVKDGRWIDPLVMVLTQDQQGKPMRFYSMLFPEAADPWNIPALNDHAIIGTWEVPPDLEKQYIFYMNDIKEKRRVALMGIVKGSLIDLNNLSKAKH